MVAKKEEVEEVELVVTGKEPRGERGMLYREREADPA
jgi:hypothetical protein